MATTKIWPVKKSLRRVVTYVMNPEKTFDGHKYLISGCYLEVSSPQSVLDQMNATKRYWDKTGGRLGYHAEQSFAPGEVTPDQAHEIGQKLAEELWGKEFEVLVTTHIDKEHIHNHFIINSVSLVTGKKYHESSQDYKEIIRKTSDRLCEEYGLSVVKEPKQKRTKAYPELHPEVKRPPSIRTLMYQDIDNAIQMSGSMAEFYQHLRDMGYEVKLNSANGPLAHPAIRPPNDAPEKERHFFRLYKFAPGYTEEDIERRIQNRVNGIEDASPTFLEAFAPKARNHTDSNQIPKKANIEMRTVLPPPNRSRKTGYYYMYAGRWLTAPAILLLRRNYRNYFISRLGWHGLRRHYFQFCFILKSVRRVSYPRYPSMELRREMYKLHKYSEEALLLNRYKIDNAQQLSDHLEAVDLSLKDVNKEKRSLNRRLKTCTSHEEAEEIRRELDELNERAAPLYKERRLLRDIEERSTQVQRIVQQEQERAKEEQQAEQAQFKNHHDKERNIIV